VLKPNEFITIARRLPREAPFSLAYAGVIIATSTMKNLRPDEGRRITQDLSTNLYNLDHHPVRALLGSALLVEGSTVLNLAVGIPPMVISERRLGPATTAAIFMIGHLGASLLTAVTIRRGLVTGYYPPEVTQALDVGPSYGGLAVRFAAIGARPTGGSHMRDIASAGALLGLTSPWKMPRDFTSTGHVIAAGIGVVAAVAIRAKRRNLQ